MEAPERHSASMPDQSALDEAPDQTFDAAEYARIRDKRLVTATLAVSGLKRTREELVTRELQPLREARSLDEIKDVLLDAVSTLMELDVFEAVSFTIDDEPALALVLPGQLHGWHAACTYQHKCCSPLLPHYSCMQ